MGSSGMLGPCKVFKGKKMPGRMGGKQRTVKNLWVYKIDPARNLMWVKGQVPGATGNFVFIKDAVYEKPDTSILPFPTYFVPEDEDTDDMKPLVADLGDVDPFMMGKMSILRCHHQRMIFSLESFTGMKFTLRFSGDGADDVEVRPAQVTVETIAVAAAVMAADTEKIVVQSVAGLLEMMLMMILILCQILTEVDEPQLAGLGEDAGSMHVYLHEQHRKINTENCLRDKRTWSLQKVNSSMQHGDKGNSKLRKT
ncbi:ribosomal protein L3 [Medicago truncatula]|uniref:Ribosomal protein L3 n=1 Tax=Medicago truncatula TaxID=3880 RepID=A0A072VAS6_MEDTR|nr:ribosomal protein L3 [Medicago truncatula]